MSLENVFFPLGNLSQAANKYFPTKEKGGDANI